MVQDTGAAKGPGGVRPLGLPRPVQVRADQRGWPVAVRLGRRWAPVRVEDRWRVDDEWWRDLISRQYLTLLLQDGAVAMVYRDLVSDKWFSQSYGIDSG